MGVHPIWAMTCLCCVQMVGMKETAASQISHTHIEGPMNYTGMMDCFVKTIRYEGVSALFKVMVPYPGFRV